MESSINKIDKKLKYLEHVRTILRRSIYKLKKQDNSKPNFLETNEKCLIAIRKLSKLNYEIYLTNLQLSKIKNNSN